MGGKITYVFLATVLVLVFGVVAMEGVLLLLTGEPAAMGMGAVAFLLPAVGGWFLWKNTGFARRANRLAAELEAEGGLPVDELKRTEGGRIDRDSADEVFARRKAETEDSPQDWRCWFRLAVAYHDARDTPGPARRCSGPSRSTRGVRSACSGRGRAVLGVPGLDRVGRPVEGLDTGEEVGVVVGEQLQLLTTLPVEHQGLALDGAGSPSQRTGCWTVRTEVTLAQGTVTVDKKPTRRTPARLTQVPMRSVRRAATITSTAMPSVTPAPPKAPATPMITAASRTKEASSSASAADPTRHDPGRYGRRH